MYNLQLLTFISVAEQGSFSKAADALFISPTAVMKQINALEERLGISVFSRTNQGLELTEAGKSLLEDAKYIIDYSFKAVEKAKKIEDQEKYQTIRIGTSIMTPAKFLLDVWNDIHQKNPFLKLELIPFDNNTVNSVEILKNLGKHIDIVAGLYDEEFLKERQCNAAFLYNKKLLFAIPVTHELHSKTEITMQDLKNKRVLLIHKNWNKFIDALREDLIRNNVIVEDFDLFNIVAFNQAVKENIPIITVEGWEDVHPLLKIVPSNWEYRIPFGIFYSLQPEKHIKNFIEILQEITTVELG
ncbi:MAG: LysR family transcriptional regulator [Anaeroplasmataceae bacterium]|nr:LysR family transcriptional regulator [Anaeroplasmataceae bacterium]